jgi:hypothetical protein
MDVTSFGLSLQTATQRKTAIQAPPLRDPSGPARPAQPPPPQDNLQIQSQPTPFFSDIDQFFQDLDMDSLMQDLESVVEDMQSLFETEESEDLEEMKDPKSWLMKELYGLNDDEKDRKLRQILREIDQENDLEKILFERKEVRKTSIKLDFRLEIRAEARTRNEVTAEGELSVNVEGRFEGLQTRSRTGREADPLIVDLGGDGFSTTGAENGVRFDIDGDGTVDQTSFVKGNDFALALDRNGNGRIDSGKELFGDQNGAKDGIAELTRFDDNRDGVIDARDSVFDSLRLMNANGNFRLSQMGVQAIDLNRLNVFGTEQNGDRYAGGLKFIMNDGSQRNSRDYWFQYRNP